MNREKLGEWWAATEPKLLSAARRYTPSPDVARDLVQDVAVLIVKHFSEFTTTDELQRWAYARLHWLALDNLRSLKRQFQFFKTDYIFNQPLQPTQEETLTARNILKHLGNLPPRQRAALEGMCKGNTAAAIAKELGITEASVRSLQRFARRNLATMMEKEDL
jgi:RNA polymerase sigma factor (sigma-70 family)